MRTRGATAVVTVDTVSGPMVVVSSADARYGCHRRLTHRRASLACEAPIARPWISAVSDGRSLADVLLVVLDIVPVAPRAVHMRPESRLARVACTDLCVEGVRRGEGQ